MTGMVSKVNDMFVPAMKRIRQIGMVPRIGQMDRHTKDATELHVAAKDTECHWTNIAMDMVYGVYG